MKPFKEEITGLRTGIIKFTLVIAVLLTTGAECQVPINGFCKLNTFSSDSGYTGILSLNYNNDFYTDLLLYSPDKNKIAVMEGSQSGTFLPYKEQSVNFQPSYIQNIFDQDKKVTGYAYVSRKKRKAGILGINDKGIIKVSNEIKLNSYPDFFSAADLDKNGFSELLISGKAFDGLSVIYSEKGKLKENKIVKGTLYSNAVLADVSNDGFADIIGYNLLTMNIDMYYNRGNGTFSKERSLPVRREIKSFRVFDMNLDSYEDFLFSYNNHIDIYTGSFSSDFTLVTTLDLKYSPDLLITSDFNRDGRIDIAYADTGKGTLSVLFANSTAGYYDEIVYTKKEGLTDLIPYYSKFINGLAFITKTGEINSITNLSSLSEEANIVPSVDITAPAYCSVDKDGGKDICFIEKYDSSIKMLANNLSGIPQFYYSFPLLQEQDQFIVSEKYGLRFIAFQKGESLVQVIKPDVITGKFTRHSFYLDDKLDDLVISEDGDRLLIYCSGVKKDELKLNTYDEMGRNLQRMSLKTGSTIVNSRIEQGKIPGIYFWQNRPDSLILLYSPVNGNNLDRPQIHFTLKQKSYDNIITFLAGKKGINSILLSVINAGKKRNVVISGERNSFMHSDDDVTKKLDITSEKLFFGELYFRGYSKMLYYSPSEKSVNRIEIIGRHIEVDKFVEDVDASGFFIKNLNLKNYHLVYINNKNCLTIKKI